MYMREYEQDRHLMKKQYDVEIENLWSQREKELADHKAWEIELLTQLKEAK